MDENKGLRSIYGASSRLVPPAAVSGDDEVSSRIGSLRERRAILEMRMAETLNERLRQRTHREHVLGARLAALRYEAQGKCKDRKHRIQNLILRKPRHHHAHAGGQGGEYEDDGGGRGGWKEYTFSEPLLVGGKLNQNEELRHGSDDGHDDGHDDGDDEWVRIGRLRNELEREKSKYAENIMQASGIHAWAVVLQRELEKKRAAREASSSSSSVSLLPADVSTSKQPYPLAPTAAATPTPIPAATPAAVAVGEPRSQRMGMQPRPQQVRFVRPADMEGTREEGSEGEAEVDVDLVSPLSDVGNRHDMFQLDEPRKQPSATDLRDTTTTAGSRPQSVSESNDRSSLEAESPSAPISGSGCEARGDRDPEQVQLRDQAGGEGEGEGEGERRPVSAIESGSSSRRESVRSAEDDLTTLEISESIIRNRESTGSVDGGPPQGMQQDAQTPLKAEQDRSNATSFLVVSSIEDEHGEAVSGSFALSPSSAATSPAHGRSEKNSLDSFLQHEESALHELHESLEETAAQQETPMSTEPSAAAPNKSPFSEFSDLYVEKLLTHCMAMVEQEVVVQGEAYDLWQDVVLESFMPSVLLCADPSRIDLPVQEYEKTALCAARELAVKRKRLVNMASVVASHINILACDEDEELERLKDLFWQCIREACPRSKWSALMGSTPASSAAAAPPPPSSQTSAVFLESEVPESEKQLGIGSVPPAEKPSATPSAVIPPAEASPTSSTEPVNYHCKTDLDTDDDVSFTEAGRSPARVARPLQAPVAHHHHPLAHAITDDFDEGSEIDNDNEARAEKIDALENRRKSPTTEESLGAHSASLQSSLHASIGDAEETSEEDSFGISGALNSFAFARSVTGAGLSTRRRVQTLSSFGNAAETPQQAQARRNPFGFDGF
eukprot:ANDGO_08340.mRNA.1 hypothetical protein